MTDLAIHKISETDLTVTVGWTPPVGAQGYVLTTNTGYRSSSLDGAKSSWRIAKTMLPVTITVLRAAAEGTYPPPAAVPFGSRPVLVAQKYQGLTDVTITNRTVAGTVPNQEHGRSLVFEGCRNVTVTDVDLADPHGGILVYACTGTITIRCRAKGCDWNVVQIVDSPMGGLIQAEATGGTNTEDMISIIGSGGTTSVPLTVEGSKLEGNGWTSPSGSGIMTESPLYVVIRNNSLFNPGQVGIGVHGPTVKAQNNRLYSDGHGGPVVRVGVDCADPASAGCEVSANKTDWRNSNGVYEPFSTLTNPYPAGWATNDWQTRFTAAELDTMRVTL